MADMKAGIRAVLLHYDGEIISFLNMDKIAEEVCTAVHLYLPTAFKDAAEKTEDIDLVMKIKQRIQDFSIDEMKRILESEGYKVEK